MHDMRLLGMWTLFCAVAAWLRQLVHKALSYGRYSSAPSGGLNARAAADIVASCMQGVNMDIG